MTLRVTDIWKCDRKLVKCTTSYTQLLEAATLYAASNLYLKYRVTHVDWSRFSRHILLVEVNYYSWCFAFICGVLDNKCSTLIIYLIVFLDKTPAHGDSIISFWLLQLAKHARHALFLSIWIRMKVNNITLTMRCVSINSNKTQLI